MTLRVLIAEDSPTVSQLLRGILEGDPGIEVVGQARNGQQAVELTRSLKPDLVTMDIIMPVLDGFQATKQIMIEAPTPIVIISGHLDSREVDVSLRALQVGALTLLPKPPGPSDPAFAEASRELLGTVKAMADVKVVRHHGLKARTARIPHAPGRRAAIEAVGVAASTGGPIALRRLLQDLPGTFPAPILLVQHISPGFLRGFAEWLDGDCALSVRLAADGERLRPGTVYLAHEDRHLGVRAGRAELLDAPPLGGFRPAATTLFASLAEAYGPAAVGLIMTGMGRDGVAGLRELHAAGGRVLAQDEETSVVFGMPGAAVAAGVVDEVVPLGRCGQRLLELSRLRFT